jgi:integrase
MQHRANPIPETMETIPGYPVTLKLFKVPCSSYWWTKAYMDGKTVKASTRTESKADAIQACKDFYNGLLLKKAQNLPLTQSQSFVRVANELIKEDQRRVDSHEVKSKRLVTDQQYILKADLLPFFGSTKLKDINYQNISDYVDYLKSRGKKVVGSNTIKRHFVLISKILKHAHKLGMIQSLPIFPTIKTQDNPREWFSPKEYETLRKCAAKCAKQKMVVRGVPVTDEMRYLITMMVNCMFRTPDLPTLKNQDISIEKTHLLITLKSKVDTQQVVSMPAALGIYKDLTEFNKAKGFGKPNDYVFFPALTRDYAMATMRRQFDAIAEKCGLKFSPEGKPRTLYSLRHTSISLRMLNAEHPDAYLLSLNARTSVDMIQRYYGSKLTPQMNVEKLQSMKSKRN